MYRYFEGNNLLSRPQYGFRSGTSTSPAIVCIAEEVCEVFEAGESLSLTLCDLSRAFDCVSHEVLLLDKLRCYGVRGVTHRLFQSYLARRTQMFSIAGANSFEPQVQCGVPQGSVPGPLLFLVLINDIDDSSTRVLFADDTTLHTRGSNPAAARAQALIQVQKAQA
jgi:hypothetical protein